MNEAEARALMKAPVMPAAAWAGMGAWLAEHHRPEHTAYHEAGHAVAAHVLGAKIHGISIIGDDRVAGRTLIAFPPSRYAGWRRVVTLWAGPAAEERGAGSTLDTDLITILPLVAELVRHKGRRVPYSDRARRRAEVLIARHWVAVDRLARGLLRHKAITGDLVHRIIAHALAPAARAGRARRG